jgi:GNAT superfamily N-acetyltransferase
MGFSKDEIVVGFHHPLYVKSVWQRHGIGRSLVEHLIHEAKQHYQLLTLRTNTIEGAEFYQKLGFKTYPNFQYMTHHLQLSELKYYPSNLR